jgi:hypothetical protein
VLNVDTHTDEGGWGERSVRNPEDDMWEVEINGLCAGRMHDNSRENSCCVPVCKQCNGVEKDACERECRGVIRNGKRGVQDWRYEKKRANVLEGDCIVFHNITRDLVVPLIL